MLHRAAISVLLGCVIDAGLQCDLSPAEAFCVDDLLDIRSCSLDPSDCYSACSGALQEFCLVVIPPLELVQLKGLSAKPGYAMRYAYTDKLVSL